MFNSIFRSKNLVDNLYDIKEISYNELYKFPTGFDDMYRERVDGFLIKNIFNKQEIRSLKNFLNNAVKSNDALLYNHEYGYTYPVPFSMVNTTIGKEYVSQEDYFLKMQELRQKLPKMLEFDFEKKLFDVFRSIGNGCAVNAPKGKENEGTYLPYSFRYFFKNKGFISVHCGNYFQAAYPAFYEDLEKDTLVFDQLSYFLVVEKPLIGGELLLFDKVWKTGQTKKNRNNIYEFIDEKGEVVDGSPKGIKRMKISPNPGDLFVYRGGAIWHMVEHIKGYRGRYTVGGYMAYSKDLSTIHLWG